MNKKAKGRTAAEIGCVVLNKLTSEAKTTSVSSGTGAICHYARSLVRLLHLYLFNCRTVLSQSRCQRRFSENLDPEIPHI
jgi:hypothetical protein